MHLPLLQAHNDSLPLDILKIKHTSHFQVK